LISDKKLYVTVSKRLIELITIIHYVMRRNYQKIPLVDREEIFKCKFECYRWMRWCYFYFSILETACHGKTDCHMFIPVFSKQNRVCRLWEW
jgi:hypothetical protein